jgi:uncharacterized protein (DUF924 family)
VSAWAEDILHYWFDIIGPEQWFNPTSEIDGEIRERFMPLWHSLRHEQAVFFVTSAKEALAAIILFDQFPRNMFRHEADAFATDGLALAISKLAMEAGFDNALNSEQQHFLFMPFMHSEILDDQDMSVELFDRLGKHEPLQFAILHRDMILRFGRFPHRNEILGRETRPVEVEAIAESENW